MTWQSLTRSNLWVGQKEILEKQLNLTLLERASTKVSRENVLRGEL